MFAIIAALLFILAAFGVTMGQINLVALGLCSLSLALLVGPWPMNTIQIGRRK